MTKAINQARILITGASRGIGRETALQLGSHGANLVLLARDRDTLEAVATEVRRRGGRATVVAADLRDDRALRARVSEILASGPVDMLVNNAGLCHQARFLSQTSDEQAQEWDVNFFGAVRLIRLILPEMLARRSGRIMNVSSLLGASAAPTTANYSATKAALEAFSQGLRGEVKGSGVSVEVFVAPHTQTEMGSKVIMDGVPSLPVEYVAGRLVKAIRRGANRSYGSPVYRLFGALVRWFPGYFEGQMRTRARTALARG